MPATLSTLAGILERWFSKPTQMLVTDEQNGYNLLSKGPWEFNGESCQVKWVIAHDVVNDATWIGELAALGVAGNELTRQLTVPAADIHKKVQISGKVLRQIFGGKAAADDIDMRGAVAQVLNGIDRAVFSGGDCVCFLNEHKLVAGGVDETWDASGDLQKLVDAWVAKGAALTTLTLVRCDTLATIANDITILLAADINVAGGQITFQAAGGVDTSTLPNGVACALLLTDADATVLPFRTLTVGGVAGLQCNGIYGGFSLPTYFGVDRTSAVLGTTNAIGKVITAATVGAHNRITLTADRLTGAFVEALRVTDTSFDLCMVEPGFLQEYAGLMSQTTNFMKDVSKGATSGDVGYKLSGLNINGVPIRTFRRCGMGLAVFMHRESWKMAECAKPEWQKFDGSILRQAAAAGGGYADGAEGYYLWSGNFVNCVPKDSVILTGFDYAGAL